MHGWQIGVIQEKRKVIDVTFPRTAEYAAEITTLAEVRANWRQLRDQLMHDRPEAMSFITEAFNLGVANGGTYFLTKLPSEVGGREAWDELVRRTAEMFACDMTRTVIEEWAGFMGLSEPSFICCCGISVGYDADERVALQIQNQMLPEALC